MKETISKVNRQFSEREKILANKTTKNYLKRCSTSLIIREMQIKTTEVSSQAGQNGHQQKSTNNKCWRGCGKRELSYIVGGNANWFTLYGDQCGDSLKIWVQNCHMTQQSPCWAYTSMKRQLKEIHIPSVHCSTINNSQDMEATQMSTGR